MPVSPRRRQLRLVPVLLLLLSTAMVHGQRENPLTGSGPAQAPRERSGGSEFSLQLSRWQGELQQKISSFIAALEGEGSGPIWVSLLGLGTLYGIVHTLLPGHRKTVLFSYFLSQEARPRDGVIAGVSLGILHAGTAVAIVLGSYWLLETSLNIAVSRANFAIQQASAWLIVGLGFVFLVAKVRHALSHPRHDHHDLGAHLDHAHGDNGGDSHDVGKPPATGNGGGHAGGKAAGTREVSKTRMTLPAIILSGLVPCPGSTVTLLFSLSLGIVYVGIATVGAISLGMALTLSIISVATIVLKRTILNQEGRFGHVLHHAIEILAAGFMLVFGLALVFLPPL